MVIVCSTDPNCEIWLGMEKGSVHRDPNPTIESYKVEVQWWKLIGTSKYLKELYKNCLSKNKQ